MKTTTIWVFAILLAAVHASVGESTNRIDIKKQYVDSNRIIRRETSIIAILADPRKYHREELVIKGYVSIDNGYAVVSYSKEPMVNTVAADIFYLDYSACTNKGEFVKNSAEHWCSMRVVIDADRGGLPGMEYHACTLVLKEMLGAYKPRVTDSEKAMGTIQNK